MVGERRDLTCHVLSSAGRSLAEGARWDRVVPQWHALLDSLAGPPAGGVR